MLCFLLVFFFLLFQHTTPVGSGSGSGCLRLPNRTYITTRPGGPGGGSSWHGLAEHYEYAVAVAVVGAPGEGLLLAVWQPRGT
uniref:Putative secreted protein n=1 Tax=Anopheles darlingi TaxID=43151 RepID=A0A2M4DL81_ANODA